MAHTPAPERRQQIVDAAIHVLAAEGLLAATTRRITEAAGVSLGSLHYVFNSKDEIFEAVLAYYASLGSAMFENIESGIGLEEGVVRGFADVAEWLIAEPETHLAQYELLYWSFRTPGMAHIAPALFETYYDLQVDLYHRVAEPADLDRDILRRIARVAIASFDGLALQHFAGYDANKTRQVSADHAEMVRDFARQQFASSGPVGHSITTPSRRRSVRKSA